MIQLKKKILLARSSNLNNIVANNNTVSSYTQQPVTDYKEDSAPNLNSDKYILDVQANKIEENPYTGNTKEIYEDAKSNNENINSDISSINETKQNVNNKSLKKYVLPIGILLFLSCSAGFAFIKKRLR